MPSKLEIPANAITNSWAEALRIANKSHPSVKLDWGVPKRIVWVPRVKGKEPNHINGFFEDKIYVEDATGYKFYHDSIVIKILEYEYKENKKILEETLTHEFLHYIYVTLRIKDDNFYENNKISEKWVLDLLSKEARN
jgi:hypothetical protein